MFLEIDNLKIYYEQFIGTSAFTTLLLHGWGANSETMRGIFNSLAAQNQSVVMLDLPYFGNSDPPPSDYDIHKYAGLVKKIIVQLHLADINLLGHSFGGRISIILASEPHIEFTIGKLILTGSAGVKPKRGIKYRFKVCVYKFKKLMGIKSKNAGSSDYRALPDSMKGVFVRVVNTHLDKLLQKIKTPTLLIWGKSDADTPLYMAKKLHKHIKNSELIVLDESAHYAFLDEPMAFNAIINAFV